MPRALSWLFADGARLVDDRGETVILRSVGWYGLEQDNVLRGTPRTPLRTRPILTNEDALVRRRTEPYRQEGVLDMIRRAGFNAVRVPISQHTLRDERVQGAHQVEPWVNPSFILGADDSVWPPDFSDRRAWGTYDAVPPWYVQAGRPPSPQPIVHSLALLDQLIAGCGRLGLRVILDMHCLARNSDNGEGTGGKWYTSASRLGGGTDTGAVGEPRDEIQAIAAWVALAGRYAGNPVVAAMDLLNEPFNCTWDAGDAHPETNVRAWYERVGNAIHAVNPDVFLWMEGVAGKAYVDGRLQDYHAFPFEELPNQAHLGIMFGANLTGVAAAPVVLNTPRKHGYSPHEYGPSEIPGIGEQVRMQAAANGLTEGQVWTIRWRKLWGYLLEQDLAPVWIGEWAARFFADRGIEGMTEALAARDLAWMDALAAYCSVHHVGHSYWALNADSARANGIALGDDNLGYTGLDEERLAKIALMLRG